MSDAEIFWLCPRCGSGNYHYDEIFSFPKINDNGDCWLELTMHGTDVTFHRRIWQFAPGWCLAHGDEGSLSQVPGSTAMSLAKKTGRSIVCGHTHRAGVQHHTQGFNGKVTNTLHGVEVGHLMDMTKASYLKSGGGNWRQAVAVATIDGSAVDVTLRLLHNGKVLG